MLIHYRNEKLYNVANEELMKNNEGKGDILNRLPLPISAPLSNVKSKYTENSTLLNLNHKVSNNLSHNFGKKDLKTSFTSGEQDILTKRKNITNNYFIKSDGTKAKTEIRDPSSIHINIGELLISDEDISCITVVGSCMAVCFYAVNTNIGSIFHAQLPYSPRNELPEGYSPLDYLDNTFDLVLEEFQKFGVARRHLRCSLMGGAEMFQTKYQNKGSAIGYKNIEYAQNFLKINNIKLAYQDTGGYWARRIKYFPNQGIIKMRYVNYG